MDLIRISLRRPIFIAMVTLFLVMLGVIALSRLPVDLYPNVDYPVLAVRAELPGAAPEEVEQLITERLEDSLSTLAGVNNMRSISREGMAIVILEFETDTDIRFEEIQARAKVANLRGSLPEAMREPTVFRRDPDDIPIMELAVTGKRDASELTKIADDEIAAKLRQIPGVGEVELEGERREEIQIELDPIKLQTWQISGKDVVSAIHAFNRNDPVGKLVGEEKLWVLRSLSQAKSVLELGSIVVGRSSDNLPIFLKDIATIKMGFSEVRRISRSGDREHSGPAVALDVMKQSGVNTLQVSERIHKALLELSQELPADIQIAVMRDNANLVRSNVNDVFESLIIGALLTILVVLLFLKSPRSTITTGIALPSSIITTFAIMAVAGFTVNLMTLLALSLAVGLLVDDAIVVRENIFRHLHSYKRPPMEAAYEGTKEVILAVLATTLTIIAVFLPVGFMSGLSGQFFKPFALTVVFAVLLSTWDALTMAPMLSAYFANISDPKLEWKIFGKLGEFLYKLLDKFEHSFDSLANAYRKLLTWLLPRPWVAAFVAILALISAGFAFKQVKKSFLPTQLGSVFSVSLNGPLAVPIEPVERVALEIEKRLSTVTALSNWTIRYGAGFSGAANINITAQIKPEFSKNQEMLGEVRDQVRELFQNIIGYNVRISEPADPLAGSSARFQPIALNVSGIEIAKIRELGEEVRNILLQTDGVSDVAPISEEGLPEIQLIPDPWLSAYYGISSATIGETLRIFIAGDSSNSLKIGNTQIPIRVSLAGGQQLSPNQLLAYQLPTGIKQNPKNVQVPLGNIVNWHAGAGPNVIVRENRQRTLRVGAGMERGAALGNIIDNIKAKLATLPLPSGYHIKITGQNEQMEELYSNIVWALLLGAIFVYMILASLFESLLQPVTVMAAIPLAAIGAVIALLLAGLPLDLYAGIGMILLAGLVAKNSILLVDFAMQRVRDHAQDPVNAVLESAPIRLRPIVMTSVAMIAGMFPVAMGWGSGGAARMGLGVATIGGIISSTLLTLLVVPNLFIVIERIASKLTNKPKQSI